MQALNGFDSENFADEPHSALLIVLFILATLITQITMLNMLIAIMGDTFGRITEIKTVSATKTKLQFLGDFVLNLRSLQSKEDKEKVFFYVMAPLDEDDTELESW